MDFFEFNFFVLVAIAAIGSLVLSKRPLARRLLLIVASLIFLASWNWQSAVAATLNALFVFYFGQILGEGPGRRARVAVAVCSQVLFLVLVRLVFPSNAGTGYTPKFISVAYLIGASYIVLQHISYLIDIDRGSVVPEKSWSRFVLYSVYFPKVLVGPIEDYMTFQRNLDDNPRPPPVARGIFLIALGLFKGLVVSTRALEFYARASASYGLDEKPFLFFWVTAVMSTVTIYSDFSALIDIGRGVSLLFGVKLSPNFDRPYLATSPVDYWRRWHMSLGLWMRKYVFFPVLLRTRSTYFAIAATMLIVAIWHGFYVELFVWAMAWAVLQCLHLFITQSLGYRLNGKSWLGQAFAIFLTFHASALIGLFTFLKLFFKQELPNPVRFSDERTWSAIREHRLLGLFIALVVVLESYEKKGQTDYFYLSMTVLLGFLISMYMTGTSYLFYYMRL